MYEYFVLVLYSVYTSILVITLWTVISAYLLAHAVAHKPTEEEQKQIEADAAFALSLMEQEGQVTGAAASAPVPPAGNESTAGAGADSQSQSSASASNLLLGSAFTPNQLSMSNSYSAPEHKLFPITPFHYTQPPVAGGDDDDWESYSSDDGDGDGDLLGDYDYYGGCVSLLLVAPSNAFFAPLVHV